MGPSGSSRNPHTLVEVTSFAAINKFQPFNVAISSNVLFLLVRAPLPPCPLWAKARPGQVAGAPGRGPWNVSSMRAGTLSACHCW